MGVVASILTEVQTSIATFFPSCSFDFGEAFVDARVPGTRIVWVPTKDPFTAASANGQRTRSVRTRNAGIDAHFYADTYAEAEDLLNALVYCVHIATHGSYDVDEAQWFAPDHNTASEGGVLKLSFMVPITAPAPTVKTVTAVGFDNSTTVAGDGALDAGES
jgi:hypothetical protein